MNRLIKEPKRFFFLLFPAILLYLYDRVAELLIVLVQQGFSWFHVSASFISTSASFMDATLSVLLTILLVIVYRIMFRKKKAEVSLSLPKGLLFATVIGFGAGGIATIWLDFIDYLTLHFHVLQEESSAFSGMYDDLEQGPYLFTFLAIVAFGPMVEEILFRGLIFRSFEEVTSLPWFAFVLSGVLFGIWHGSFIQGVYTAIMGIILGYFIKKTRSFLFVIFAHAVNNLSGTLPPSLDTDANNTLITWLSYLCILPALVILFYLHQKSKQKA